MSAARPSPKIIAPARATGPWIANDPRGGRKISAAESPLRTSARSDGPNPPYHHPVFVLTHHARAPLEMEGGTTFYFVTEGIEAALDRAKRAAGGKDVSLGGGAMELDQQLIFRPAPELSHYRTPLRGLYVAGASTHPGGAVHGMSGRGAARAVLRDRRFRPWRAP